MHPTKSIVFQQINMDVNSPMEDTIGGIVADISSDIRLGHLQRAEIEARIERSAREAIRTGLVERDPLIRFIVLTAETSLLAEESRYEKFYLGRVPSEPPYDDLEAGFERILGHATEAIINGVVGNLAEACLYRPNRTILL